MEQELAASKTFYEKAILVMQQESRNNTGRGTSALHGRKDSVCYMGRKDSVCAPAATALTRNDSAVQDPVASEVNFTKVYANDPNRLLGNSPFLSRSHSLSVSSVSRR